MFTWPLLVVSVVAAQPPSALERTLRAAYCVEDEEIDCRLRGPEKVAAPQLADFHCAWAKNTIACTQKVAPPAAMLTVAREELIKVGLPATESRVFVAAYRVRPEWTVVHAYHHRVTGERMSIASVVLMLRDDGTRVVLETQRFARDPLDGPNSMRLHFVLDVRDLDGDGAAELVLDGEAYEAHWLEVFTWRDEKWRPVFSGLGYAL